MKIISHFLRKLIQRKEVSIESAAETKTVFHEDIASVEHPIYFEDENLNRIPEKIPKHIRNIEFWGDRSRNTVKKYLIQGSTELDKSIIYKLNDVLLTKNALYCGHYRHAISFPPRKDYLLPAEYRQIDHGVLAHNFFSTRFWGHWLMSELPMQVQLQKEGPLIGNSLRTPYRDEQSWRDILELPGINRAPVWRINSLVMCDPLAMDPLIIKGWYSIREKVLSGQKTKKLVYIKRDQTGQQRSLTNEEELLRRLDESGFSCIDISKINGDALINALSGADVVIGVEGSHMDPAMYSVKDGGSLIILQPPGRVSLNTVTNSSICGVHSAVYICNQKEDFFKFEVDIENFLHFVDRVVKRAGQLSQHMADRTNSLKEKLS